jgi:hypothetical protein
MAMKSPSNRKPVIASSAVTTLCGLFGVNGEAKTLPWKAELLQGVGIAAKVEPADRVTVAGECCSRGGERISLND